MATRRRRHTPEQIIRKLREGEKQLGQGAELPEVCRRLEITEATWYWWRNQYGGMKGDDAKRLEELERENARLKKMVAEQALDIDMLKELNPGKLVSPGGRRRAVDVLQQRFGVSQRRACAVVGRHRSTQRRAPGQASDVESMLRTRLREISRAHLRWGWRKAYWLLRGEGHLVNHKRIRRYWAVEGLTRPVRSRKRQRVGPQRGDRLTATCPDQVWALDFQVDVTADGRQIRWCNVVDEFTREALATAAARSFTADDTTILLDKIIAETGRRPANLRMDNGPELTAAAMRDWCRFAEVATVFIEPGSPWQNGYSESFNGRFRDEFLTTEQFDTLLEAQVLADDWRTEYNTTRPHGSLGGLTPTQFRQQWTNQPALS
ncbi:IS3 family transposase [Actinophytocola sp. S1-96]|uniref:IS3 family transposase n=1 Tax=Actinophytocola gossypii TaxID=2812003 RepID=A0ABT2JJA2_9PSEU|nr:IS3 family transposase [Actinophytocola gossypii]MCT2587960.1 IS3 family transposase [Actinophytocola gossypii]